MQETAARLRQRWATALAISLVIIGSACKREHGQDNNAFSATRTLASEDAGATGSAAPASDASAPPDAAVASTRPVYCIEGGNGVPVPAGRGTPRDALLGKRFDVVPFKKSTAGRMYYLVAEHDHAFQFLIDGLENPGPNMTESAASCDGGRDTIHGHVGLSCGPGCGMALEFVDLAETPLDVYQAIAVQLDGHSLRWGYRYVRASCNTSLMGVPSCSAEVTQGPAMPTSDAMFWAAYIPRTRQLISLDLFTPNTQNGADAVLSAARLLKSTFKASP